MSIQIKRGVFAHPERNTYLIQKQRVLSYYKGVLALLARFKEKKFYSREEEWVYESLYAPFEASPVDREKRLDQNIKSLTAISKCRERGFCCRRTATCIECAGDWRYSKAASILRAAKENKKLRLLLRRETIMVPRCVCYDSSSPDGLKLLADGRINPVHQFPVGSKSSPTHISQVIEDDLYKEYSEDPDYSTDQYDVVNEMAWRTIGGVEVSERYSNITHYNEISEERQQAVRDMVLKLKQDTRDKITKGKVDRIHNPIIPELLAQATCLSRHMPYSEGYIHRLIITPPYKNKSVVLVQLNSLFLSTPEIYKELKETNPLWKTDPEYIKYPLNQKDECYWFYGVKTSTSCRYVPKDIYKLLELLEKRFPAMGERNFAFLPEEFLFYFNCLTQYKTLRCGGVLESGQC